MDVKALNDYLPAIKAEKGREVGKEGELEEESREDGR